MARSLSAIATTETLEISTLKPQPVGGAVLFEVCASKGKLWGDVYGL
jgi:hypothetical protein